MTTFLSSINTTGTTAYSLGSNEDVFIRSTIYITAGGSVGLRGTAGDSDVTVAGVVEAPTAIYYQSATYGSVSILDTGVVAGQFNGFWLNSTSTTDFHFRNDGTLIGGNFGLDVFYEGAFFGVNSGLISSNANDAVRIQTQNGGAFSNYGRIETLSTNNAVDIYHDGFPDDPATFYNYGIISTFGIYALEMDSNDANRAFNYGTFNGGAFFGSNDDMFVNRGTINGDVDLDAGDDFYRGFGGTVSGDVFAGAGNDTLNGGDGSDQIYGEDDNDLIRGFGGNDRLWGGSGGDDLYGQDGDDEIHGGSGFDYIEGGRGDDLLLGEANNDRIFAGAGTDTIFGGFGRDTMFGGDGRDEFHWEAAGESGSFANRDRVWRFEQGEDRLDFSDVTGPAITFRGTAGFTGNGPEMRAYVNAFGNTIIAVDTTGNGSANMFVQSNGSGYTADDFIL